MSEYDAVYVLLLRGIAAGAMAALAAGLLLGRAPRAVRIAGVLTCLASICYAIVFSGLFEMAVEPVYGLTLVMTVISFAVVPLAWLFVVAVFDDRAVNPATLAPTLILVSLLTVSSESLRFGAMAANLSLVLSALLTLHGLYVVARGWRGDLVETRRRLRGPLAVLIGGMNVYTLWALLYGFGLFEFEALARAELYNAIFEAIWAICAVAVILDPRSGLLIPAPRRTGDDRAGAAERAALAKLETLMEEGEAWRREGLTIGALAAEIGVGEQRLRRLINGRLGHRNFASFINAYRVAAARARLADPEGQETVAQIAFDLGFTSLGPFNRAFKDIVGQTPTEWRKGAAPAE